MLDMFDASCYQHENILSTLCRILQNFAKTISVGIPNLIRLVSSLSELKLCSN